MTSVFLSPSTQEYNLYVTGNSEEYYTNLITDAMIPYLNASGISYGRNDPNGTVSTSIAMSNAGNYNLHLAIHSNAAPESMAGMLRGPDVYYYRDSARGKAAAEIFANNLEMIYPIHRWLNFAKLKRRLFWWKSPITTTGRTPIG